MLRAYHKKVDRSMMDWGVTIPKDLVKDFEMGKPVKLGSSRDIEILWDKKKYLGKLAHVNRTNANPVYQIRWESNKELLNKVRKTFIQSYVILKSQKELFDKSKNGRKRFRTKLTGGQQEVIRIKPINRYEIKLDVYIRIENEWNELFQRLAEENVFGWLFDKTKRYLIAKSTNWIKVKDFIKHSNALNVIYYLANSRKKMLYIGKAENLGKRVKPGKKHMDMDGDWDLFRYDIIHPEFANLLERLEDHTIRSFASILRNNKDFQTLGLGDYKLVNKNWKKL